MSMERKGRYAGSLHGKLIIAIPAFWNEGWIAALVNHLWQSTVVIWIVSALALRLRKNHTHACYWILMAASIKFLPPFSLLMVVGADLKKRIVRIMTEQMAGKLGWGSRLLLTAIASVAVAASVFTGLVYAGQRPAPFQSADAAAKPQKFEVASIRAIPDKDVVPLPLTELVSPPGAGQFTMREATLGFVIGWAFGTGHVTGGPDWLNRQNYEISAKPEGDVGLTYDQLRPLMQQLLQERFHLVYHLETKEVKGYALVAAKGGPKLKASTGKGDSGYIVNDRIHAQNAPVQALAGMIEVLLHEAVADKTGLTGNFDFELSFAPTGGADSDLPSIFTAIEELGLKLVPQSVPVEMFVVDHVEQPSLN